MFLFNSKKDIERSSLLYTSLRFYTRICFRCFYKNIHYTGRENIPDKGPVIFAPNHQNALMDALAVLLWQKRPVVFMARADMFQKKWTAFLLRLIKIMPVYRMRDGYSKLSKNEQQFKEACSVLLNNGTLCLMPEGSQDGHRRLRSLVKGLFRIALEAQLAVGKSRDVQIVPVGIDYSEYEQPGADLVVHFGKAIFVSDFAAYYEQDPVLGMNVLRETLAEKIKDLITDIHNADCYEEIYGLSRLLSPAYLQARDLKKSALNCFEARRQLSLRLKEFFENKNEEKTQTSILKEFHVIYDVLPGSREDKYCLLENLRRILERQKLKIVFMALALFPAYIINWPIRKVIQAIVKLDKDRQMHSSYRFALSALLLPLWYIVLSILPVLLFNFSILKAFILFLVFILAACSGGRFIPAFRREFRLMRFLHAQPSELRSKLISTLNKLEDLGRDYFVA
ncbi:MAG: 1-acyl-sn-glycerol-3-phosphate acyltransferase [Bacteroidales bacterium]|nr:1-acyl-sn-glycerol-3-phosphate acyltransferase [Bacteroidales bacterium]